MNLFTQPRQSEKGQAWAWQWLTEFIDDEETLRDIAKKFLADAGYHAITAESGEAGLSIYKEKMQSISIIFLDLIMPGMGGRNCLQEILEINPSAKVIICSGYTPDDPETDEILQKAICFLKKPYDFNVLLQLVEKEIFMDLINLP